MIFDVTSNPNDIIAGIGAFVSFFIFLTNRRINRMALSLDRYKTEIAKYTADQAARMTDLKEIELRNVFARTFALTLLNKLDIVREDIANLRALLAAHIRKTGKFKKKTKEKATRLCISIYFRLIQNNTFSQ